MVTFSNEEKNFISNIVVGRYNDDSKRQTEEVILKQIMVLLIGDEPVESYTSQQVGFLQYLMQELSEIDGRMSSTANEKLNVLPSMVFRPQRELILIKSVAAKLGAKLPINASQPTDERSTTPKPTEGYGID